MDGFEIAVYVVALVAIIALWGALCCVSVAASKNKKKKQAPSPEQEEAEARLQKAPEYVEARARLTAMRCGVDVRGTTRVSVNEKYFITFELEGGRTVEFEVGEDIYSLLEEGMDGILVTVEGNFFGFESDS